MCYEREQNVRQSVTLACDLRLSQKETLLKDKPNSREAKARAEASFKKKDERAREGAKAAAEYEANILAVREKTARLRALRLATMDQKVSSP
jgi:hypothetical protein